jgi:hypothetical protein
VPRSLEIDIALTQPLCEGAGLILPFVVATFTSRFFQQFYLAYYHIFAFVL